jgi:hypothetical protein
MDPSQMSQATAHRDREIDEEVERINNDLPMEQSEHDYDTQPVLQVRSQSLRKDKPGEKSQP